jgi:protein FAM32A
MSQIIRKKKSKSKSRPDDVKEDRERVKELLSSEDVGSTPASASGSNRASPSLSNGNERKTDAERRFEEAQRRRVSLRLISPFIH